MKFRRIENDSDLRELSALASEIWNVHYPPIIGQEQVDYMLKLMYSPESLRKQIAEGSVFISSCDDADAMTGFISYSRQGGNDFMIHKWYVDPALHGKGIGRALFDAAFEGLEYDTIRLTVNRQNFTAVNFYFRFGFVIEKIVDMDIGGGFVMNDFVMILRKGARK